MLIAGKGHEQGQIVGGGRNMRVLPFDDVTVARECAGMNALGADHSNGCWPIPVDDVADGAVGRGRACRRRPAGSPAASSRPAGSRSIAATCVPGDLFFALKGEAIDGHRFVDKAFANGARRRWSIAPSMGRTCWSRTRPAHLRVLAAAARDALARRGSIGVTGSVGKTGVKEAIFAALERSSRGAAHRSVKSYNNHVGVPLSLARMPARARFGVFEMGMNHAGEIAALTAQVRPHVAVITTIAPAHIENLGSEEAIADAKAEIFAGLRAGRDAVIPADSPHFARLRVAAARPMRAVIVVRQRARMPMSACSTRSPPPAAARWSPRLSAIGGCATLSPSPASTGSPTRSRDGRGSRRGGRPGRGRARAGRDGRPQRPRRAPPDRGAVAASALLIDESYNANPASMRATLRSSAQTPAHAPHRRARQHEGAWRFRAAFHAELAEPLAAAASRSRGPGRRRDARARARIGESAGAAALGKAAAFAHCATAGRGDCGARGIRPARRRCGAGEGFEFGRARRRLSPHFAARKSRARMLYLIAQCLDFEGLLNLVRYQTFRAGRRC